jgi:hypothetical protein
LTVSEKTENAPPRLCHAQNSTVSPGHAPILPPKRPFVLLFFALFYADPGRFQKNITGGALNFSFKQPQKVQVYKGRPAGVKWSRNSGLS